MNYSNLDKDAILENGVYEDIIDEQDPVTRADMINDLLDRAKELNKKTEVRRKLSAFEKLEREARKPVPAKQAAPATDNVTAFNYPHTFSEMRSGVLSPYYDR